MNGQRESALLLQAEQASKWNIPQDIGPVVCAKHERDESLHNRHQGLRDGSANGSRFKLKLCVIVLEELDLSALLCSISKMASALS